jgi:hypothetical protein
MINIAIKSTPAPTPIMIYLQGVIVSIVTKIDFEAPSETTRRMSDPIANNFFKSSLRSFSRHNPVPNYSSLILITTSKDNLIVVHNLLNIVLQSKSLLHRG